MSPITERILLWWHISSPLRLSNVTSDLYSSFALELRTSHVTRVPPGMELWNAIFMCYGGSRGRRRSPPRGCERRGSDLQLHGNDDLRDRGELGDAVFAVSVASHGEPDA